MIGVYLMGGLGNIMFQIAMIENLGYENNFSVGYDIDSYFSRISEKFKRLNIEGDSFVNYFSLFKNLTFSKCNLINLSDCYQAKFKYEELPINDNLKYYGYFQSEKYFNNREFTQEIFEPSILITSELDKYSKILNGYTCSIHVRRGDYLLNQNVFHMLPLTYYRNAIECVGNVDNYLIFSDDINWCKNNFSFLKNVIFIENEKDYVELYLQSKCSHNIIANSSFSWWGAYLNKNKNKIVVSPKQWFISGNEYSSDDIIPLDWKIIL